MANTWQDKTVYIRETTRGKTRWVKLEGVKARRSSSGPLGRLVIKLTNFDENKMAGWVNPANMDDEKHFVSRSR